MAYVEQAIFTSAETDRSAGYQVVARSPGVCSEDARELAIWGPSHDSLLELGPDAVSLNFHPLPSGACCVSRTTPAGWEYSGRGGHRVYTQCLIVPPEVLERFANNPFALIRAAQATGALDVLGQVPKRLEPLQFPGGAAAVDQTLLARLAANPGAEQLAVLVQAALDSSCLAVARPFDGASGCPPDGMPSAAQLIAGLLNCLPPECRTAFSFSTGLKFSSRRPYRIVALSGDQAEQRWVAHQNHVTVLLLSDALPVRPFGRTSKCPSDGRVSIQGWAQLIKQVAASGRTSFLATQLSKRRFHLSCDDLPALGLQLLEDFDASALRNDHESRQQGDTSLLDLARQFNERLCKGEETFGPSSRPASDEGEGLQRAHAAHCRFGKSLDAPAAAKLETIAPAKTLKLSSPEVLEKLEHLDDLVYEAISGQAAALEQLETLWPQILDELGAELVTESREQYLRYALTIWEECVDSSGVRDPARAVQALDVLCMLFGES